jgi:hypothetical protein
MRIVTLVRLPGGCPGAGVVIPASGYGLLDTCGNDSG